MSAQTTFVIHALETHPSRLNKEAIIEAEAQAGNDIFFEGLRLALDPMITFGVKKVPKHGGPDGQGLPWVAFRALADDLASRKLTGDNAKKAIELALSCATQSEWNDWYMRILQKDLRAGFGESTVNKVVKKINPAYMIPVFECQLAHDSANHESKVCGKRLIEVKLDGVRVLTIVYPNGQVNQYSRNGKELVNFGHIKEQFEKVSTGLTEPWVFDGEIMSSSFQDLMKQVHRKSDVQANDSVLNLFDCVPLAMFKTGKWKFKQTDRSAHLVNWYNLHSKDLPNVAIVGQELVDLDTAEGKKRYKEINAQAIAGGYEGIMLKDPAAGYECKRSVAWLKLKPFIEVSLEVTNLEEGTGKNVGKLGALVCEGVDDGKTISVNVGSGFSDDLRDSVWGDRTGVVGQIVEVRADAVTQNQDGTYSLRFPRFLRFRGFEAGEKL
ncbi:CDC9 ATP-dependent DNA ligase [uncultured Caudovirales phage]|uniref:DNA ligase n=1 Tax=uncultured Caudovirales phage TaxID=2100421 RepID=A0A6J5T9R8_9CAUD|nr:CDC9 ATP-dependent DNA ligase [uncultured Caudovirales phage]